MFNFEETAILFSIVAAPFYIFSPTMHKVPISPHLISFCLFFSDTSHLIKDLF
ncbi:hypothetical protein Cadr_000011602 [Camelus dromedarius]|uniref:Uncharacterized protein n=1 Tax=Camelus dromedarius TaxID=9838 RepID=A0A5N4DUX8_CAMDR|nr:hypothetical protein Cadr_000011602 [Camelus dromedarius]